MSERQLKVSRREVLGGTSLGLAGALAGCLGGNSSSSGLNITMPATGYWTVVMKKMESEGVLRQNLEDVGYEINNFQYTWDGAPLFASGQADICHLTGIEMARLGPERDIQTTVSGHIVTNFMGLWTRPGTPYDPDEAGSQQAAVDNIVNDDAKFVIDGWGSGTIPPARVAMNEYGYTFSEEGDFNTVTGELTSIPTLIADGTADVGITSPMHGAGQIVLDEQIKPVLQYTPWSNNNVGFIPSLNNVTTTKEFFDGNTEAIQALVDTWDEGLKWLYETGSDAIQTDEDLTNLGCKTIEGGQYVMEWGLGNQDVPYSFESPAIHESAYMSGDYVEGQMNFLDRVANRGLVPSNWKDYVSFEQVEK